MACLLFGLCLILLHFSDGIFGSSPAFPGWTDLRVTWGINVFSGWTFDKMPRNFNSDTKKFTLLDDQCTKNKRSNFLGKRYWYKNDPAIIVLSDVNGYVAGIQTAIPKSKFSPSDSLKNHPYISDSDYWTLTAYFVDPQIICTSGRDEASFSDQGTGTGLWIQNGTDPLVDVVKIPLKEDDAKKTSWTFGKCFYTMGDHFWFNVTAGMECGKFFPMCLMYNKGVLNAFCFAVNAGLDSNRYEHPTVDQTKKFINPVPDCFYSDPSFATLSSIHVFFNHPLSNFC